MITCAYVPPVIPEGKVNITLSENEAAKLLALIACTNSNHFNELYRELNKLSFPRVNLYGICLIDLQKVYFVKK